MARTPAGLTEEQVGGLRSALEQNKRPKVTVAGQQFGGETTGQVVTVGEPEIEGPEFIQVRVRLDGLTDVLRFAPRELRLPQRGRAAALASTAGAGAPVAGRAPRRAATPKPRAAATAGGVAAAPTPPTPAGATQSATASTAVTTSAESTKSQPVARSAVAPKSAARPRKAAVRPPTVTITMSSSGTDWTVTANRGGKSVLKAAAIAPGVVAAAVELFGEPTVSAAVDEVNGAALSLAQQRAEELRAELAAVESLLAAHRAPRS
ncbi:hypothetical protein ABLG96_18215 [Nakamurella sp. A5-74]|uniref:Translation initiation factor n=1 Tax=Nakamurella sp. A5-74 TaxID=3158264 RepID=A0AAU8DMB3_9ACTN